MTDNAFVEVPPEVYLPEEFLPESFAIEQWSKECTPAELSSEEGYDFLSTSQWWRDRCKPLPCFIELEWPGYATAVRRIEVEGKPVVIQCWKGYCQEFAPQLHERIPNVYFPGGIGAEVAIYTDKRSDQAEIAVHDELLPRELALAIARWFLRFVAHLKNPKYRGLWWPAFSYFAEAGNSSTFSLYDPRFDDPLISEYSTPTYWTCRWMQKQSYVIWLENHGVSVTDAQRESPWLAADEYTLRFSVAGDRYIWAAGSDEIVPDVS